MTVEALVQEHVHQVPADDVIELLDSSAEQGLDMLEVRSRLEQFGPNSIPPARGRGPLLQFILQFHQPLIYMLLGASAITAIFQEWIDASVILAVVLVNAIIGFLQESKAAKALEALAETTVTGARVLRAGEVRNVESMELVPGDIVLLQSGDKVPADLRLFRTRDLQIDESALTGESVAVEKHVEILPREIPLGDRRNLAYTSTLVTYGQGRGVVTATGTRTEIGRISELLSTADVLETPLTRKIARFSHILLGAILCLAAVTFAIGIAYGEEPFEMFMAAVALAVGAIPEGLPAVVTITMAIGVSRMARRRAIIRKLPAVEALGSTTTICSDKTGTLTVNQMTVRNIWGGGAAYNVTGTGYAPAGEILQESADDPTWQDNAAARECLLCGLVCNDSTLVAEEGRWDVQGDPTEGALVASAGKVGLQAKEWSNRLPRLDAIPFESQHQYMATLHREGESGHRMYVKGAMEVLLAKCTASLDASGNEVSFDPEEIGQQFERMAAAGLRVLAFAVRTLPASCQSISHEDVHSLTFVGLQGMLDPPRDEVIAAVRACQTAGIQVKMITGDHALTARAIARQIGLNGYDSDSSEGPAALTATELAQYSDAELIEAVDQVAVFARVAPEQKLRLVRAFQARGHVVAMTGDGVNDAPALKQADIGVAMGVGGTEVAKEAADMILTDDNFATIEAAVEEGRNVFDNLTKFIVWTLPTNLGEALVILTAIVMGIALPIVPVQILWINMTTAVLLGMMLAFEPKASDIMSRAPRNPKTPLLRSDLVIRMIIVSIIMLMGAFGSYDWALSHGASQEQASTVAVNVFVMVELFYLFNCRSLDKSMFALGVFSNRWLFVGAAGMILLQLGFTYLPLMNRLFHSAPIGWGAWWRILLTALATYVVVGTEKWLRRKWAAQGKAPATPEPQNS